MLITSLTRLDLRSQLSYIKTNYNENDVQKIYQNFPKNEEILLCYKLNPSQSRNIEPDRENFLDSLLFIGQKPEENSLDEANTDTGSCAVNTEAVLPAGNYLFTQCRSEQTLNKDEWLDIAIEQQKDCLWERQKPGDFIYIRFLYEDNAYVTQIFRPASG